MKSHYVFPEPWNQGDGLGKTATEAGVLLFMNLLSNPESHLYKWFSQENAIHLGERGLDIVLRGPGHCETHSSGPAQWPFMNHIHLEEGAGGEREESQWVQKLTFFFFFWSLKFWEQFILETLDSRALGVVQLLIWQCQGEKAED